jgi:methylthioribose-1-phosphate isomerase
MIDQRVLPAEVTYLSYASASQVAEGIGSMVVRGAPAIGCAAAFGIALEALALRNEDRSTFTAGMNAGMDALAVSRPTAVNLVWAIDRMRKKWSAMNSATASDVASALVDEANKILEEDIAANRRMGAFGAALIPDGSRVLTHCNAGALATGGHGTALGVLRSAVESGKSLTVIADETRPFLQGARLTAWELAQDGIPVTLIVDSAAAFMMSRGEIDQVIVGADRIARNGDVANKIGTYGLAVAAAKHGIPFYVAAPLSTFDPELDSGDAIPIEERNGDEIRGYRDNLWASRDVVVKNLVFDVTPAELITAIITEHGVLMPPFETSIAAMLADAGRAPG